MNVDALPARPFTVADAQDRGVDRHALRRLVDGGGLRRPVRGVYVPAALKDSVELRAKAAACVVTENHVLVDRTAAWLHGINSFALGELVHPPIETCALRGRNPTRRRELQGRTRDLAETDIMHVLGVRVTTPLRTALDLGCHLRRREAYAVLNEFARLHGIDKRRLRWELIRFKRRRGVVQLRELIELIDPRIESVRESWTFLAIYDAGLPLPEPQFWIEADGRPVYRLDFAYPRAKICVEYDGVEAHDLTPEQREHDRRRRAWLRAHGWTVIVVRRGDFSGEAPDRWLGELRHALQPTYSTRRW